MMPTDGSAYRTAVPSRTGECGFLRTAQLFPSLRHTLAAPLLEACEYPWQALAGLADFLRQLGATLPAAEYEHPAPEIWIARSARVSPAAVLTGPCILGSGAELRPGAFLRGSVLVGAGAVVGNSTELKNAILFESVQVPHYNYIGDSILGWQSHLGAGAVTSNVKSDRQPVVIHAGSLQVETGLKKLGAILADRVEVGCGSVLNPGTVIGAGSRIYPLTAVRGFIPAGHIYKGEKGLTPIADT